MITAVVLNAGPSFPFLSLAKWSMGKKMFGISALSSQNPKWVRVRVSVMVTDLSVNETETHWSCGELCCKCHPAPCRQSAFAVTILSGSNTANEIREEIRHHFLLKRNAVPRAGYDGMDYFIDHTCGLLLVRNSKVTEVHAPLPIGTWVHSSMVPGYYVFWTSSLLLNLTVI